MATSMEHPGMLNLNISASTLIVFTVHALHGIMKQTQFTVYRHNNSNFACRRVIIILKPRFTCKYIAECTRNHIDHGITDYGNRAVTELEVVVARIEYLVYTIKNSMRVVTINSCLLYTSPSPRDATLSRMPSSA